MKTLSKLSALLLIFSFSFAVLQTPVQTTAQENEEQSESEESEENENVVYEYVAQAGDSYSLIARKAVQTYGLKYDVSLNEAQIIYAETNLTRTAGSPEINEGSSVTVDESTIEEWVDNAEELTEDQQAAWDVYARVADFNTDNVGESRE
jgi:tRNA A37 threonylcarbamoyltransferase TsaD